MFCSYLQNISSKLGNDEGAANDADCLDWYEVSVIFFFTTNFQKKSKL